MLGFREAHWGSAREMCAMGYLGSLTGAAHTALAAWLPSCPPSHHLPTGPRAAVALVAGWTAGRRGCRVHFGPSPLVLHINVNINTFKSTTIVKNL